MITQKKLPKMKTLVTGGGGFLGGHIVERLLGEGRDIRVFGRSRRPELERLGVEVVCGNLVDSGDCQRAVEGCDVIFHTAALAGVSGPAKVYESVNVEGTSNLLMLAKQHGVKAFIYTSSPSVVFDGQDHDLADESLPYPSRYLCHYPRTKAIAERMVLSAHSPHELRTIALRPHLIWGKGDPHLIPRILEQARKGRLRQVGRGDNRVHMVHVKNAAHAHLLAEKALLDNPSAGGHPYFITDDDPVKLWPWVKDLLHKSGIPWSPQPISSEAAYLIGHVLERFYSLFGIKEEPPMTRFVARQLSTTHTYNITRAREVLGYAPIVSMEQGLKELLEL